MFRKENLTNGTSGSWTRREGSLEKKMKMAWRNPTCYGLLVCLELVRKRRKRRRNSSWDGWRRREWEKWAELGLFEWVAWFTYNSLGLNHVILVNGLEMGFQGFKWTWTTDKSCPEWKSLPNQPQGHPIFWVYKWSLTFSWNCEKVLLNYKTT